MPYLCFKKMFSYSFFFLFVLIPSPLAGLLIASGVLSPLSFFFISRRGNNRSSECEIRIVVFVVFLVLFLRIQQSEHKRAQRGAWLFLLLARLCYMLTELLLVFRALRWVSQLCVHLFPCVAKARLRLLLCFGRIVYAVRFFHAYAV